MNGVITNRWLYAGQLHPIAEVDSIGKIIAYYHSSYMKRGDTLYRIIRDHLGSVRLIVNIGTGAITQRIDYDEWGNVTFDSNPGFQLFAFAGGLYDVQTKLVRFSARDYDAQSGRWMIKDPILFKGNTENIYSYVRNNPINYMDASGLTEIYIFGQGDLTGIFGGQVNLGIVINLDNPSQSGFFGGINFSTGASVGVSAGLGYAPREIEGRGYNVDVNGLDISATATFDDKGSNGFAVGGGPGIGASASAGCTKSISFKDAWDWIKKECKNTWESIKALMR